MHYCTMKGEDFYALFIKMNLEIFAIKLLFFAPKNCHRNSVEGLITGPCPPRPDEREVRSAGVGCVG
jgi:hypothetical protein